MADLKDSVAQRNWGAIIGVALFLAVMLLPAPAGMPAPAWKVAGVALLMAMLWITEALPIPATALLPLILFPLFGVASMRDAASPYADPVIFLFFGGFIIGLGMQRWSLHRRLGLRAILWIGTSPHRLIAGFMVATALLSMWVSNTATTIMMLPVALSVLTLFDERAKGVQHPHTNLGIVLMLAVAYGASIGGLGTLIGTPPNALLAAYMAREHGIQIGFAQWMALGLPVVTLMLTGAWLILIRIYPVRIDVADDAAQVVQSELDTLGPISAPEIRTACVFGLTALAWITRPLYAGSVSGIDDTTIAVAGAFVLFLIPSGAPEGGRLLAWDDVRTLPWGVLILFGGGLSLAGAINSSGLAAWLGANLHILITWPVILIVAIATLAMIFLTELTSNTASAATFLPIGGAIALGIGLDPITLIVPLALAASCAFMLPVATPPNAIVFSSGRITIAQMARVGFWINLFGAGTIVAASYPLAGWLFTG